MGHARRQFALGRQRSIRRSAGVFAIWLVLVAGCGPGEPGQDADSLPTPGGGPSYGLNLLGEHVDPLAGVAAGKRATVLLFVRTDCPVSNRYAPTFERLVKKYRADDIRFYLVYPNPDANAAQIGQHLKDYSYSCDALHDPEHQLVRMTGVRITPEAAVYAAGGRLVYRGRIDNRYVEFGKTRPQATEHDLDKTLAALVGDRDLTLHTTEAVGCSIENLK